MKFLSSMVGLCMLCGSMAMTSCSHEARFLGSWKSSSAVSMASSYPSSAVASLTSIDFWNNQETTDGGVKLVNTYYVSEPVLVDSIGTDTVEMKLTANASAEGTWAYDIDDKDDLLLSFDLSSVEISINPDDITFTPPVNADVRQSLVIKITNSWKRALSHDFSETLTRFSVVDDIEVSKDGGVMTLEVNSPETKMHFRKVIP